MLKKPFFKTIFFLFCIVLFNSCDKELSVVGEDLVGENTFDIHKDEFSLIAYNKKIGPIQSNDMPVNALGIYANPSFGTTKANFTTQVSLDVLAPVFDKAKIKSVVLTIPYYYDSSKTALKPDGSGDSTYVLDSIYGPDLAKMKLSVYQSGYFMKDLDPEEQLTQPQKYYTNQYADFFGQKGMVLNDDASPAQNSEFFFDPTELKVESLAADGVTKVITRSPPAMKLNLNKVFFQENILEASDDVLGNASLFKDHFKGLVFDVQNIGSTPGNMAMINFKGGKITVTYTETVDAVEVEKSITISLSGHTNSFLEQSNVNPDYDNGTNPSNIDDVKGDSNLYLKGGEGSLSILKLFGEDKFGADGVTGAPNTVPDQLDILRHNKCLVNQAQITVHLNSTAMTGSYYPQRIYLYDYDNNRVLLDYTVLSDANNPKYNKYVFGGILEKNDNGYFYKFRITQHIRNLINNSEVTNIKLGLVVTENINRADFYSFRDKTGYAPMASVMNPLGAIVFGNNIPEGNVNYDKRVKFEIYYTKAN